MMKYKIICLVLFLIANACKKNNLSNPIPAQGYLVNGNIADSSELSNWIFNTTSAKVAFDKGLSVQNGDSSYRNYMEYQLYAPFEKNSYYVSFIAGSKDERSYGVVFTTGQGAASYSSSIQCGINLTNGPDSGKIFIGYDIAPKMVQSSIGLQFNVGDSIGLYLYFNGWDIFFIANNYTKPSTVNCSMTNSSMIGSGGKFRIAFLGGRQQFKKISIFSNSKTKTGTVIIGNSISAGAGATMQANRYIDRIFKQNASAYEDASHPSIKITDVMKYFSAIAAIKSKYAIISLGENERNGGLDTGIFRFDYDSIVYALMKNGTRPVLVSLCPSGWAYIQTLTPAYNNIIADIAKKYDLDFVDITTVLLNGGNALSPKFNFDNVHPNDSGHWLIANTIITKAPYLLN